MSLAELAGSLYFEPITEPSVAKSLGSGLRMGRELLSLGPVEGRAKRQDCVDSGESREQFENSYAQTPGKTDYDDAPEHRTKQLD